MRMRGVSKESRGEEDCHCLERKEVQGGWGAGIVVSWERAPSLRLPTLS